MSRRDARLSMSGSFLRRNGNFRLGARDVTVTMRKHCTMPSSKGLRNNRIVFYRVVPRISLGDKEFRISGKNIERNDGKNISDFHRTLMVNLQIFSCGIDGK